MTAPPIQRIFHHQLIWQLTDQTFHRAARMIALAAEHRFGPLGAVVGVAHGGVPLATLTAGILRLPQYAIAARHNPTSEPYEQATGHVQVDTAALTETLNGTRLPGTVLLVDDICGSAATLAAAAPTLRPFLAPPHRIVTAVLCRNTGAAADPDLWVWDVSDWVIFPWEDLPPRPTVALPAPTGIRTP